MSSQLLAVQQPMIMPRPQTAAAAVSYPARCGSGGNSQQLYQQQQPIIRELKRERTFHNEGAWRNQVKKDIDANNRQMEKSDAHIYVSKRVDPLSNLREVLRTLSNAQAFKYMRQCRLVVGKLKKTWVDVNEEIKSLTKSKEYLESGIDHIRKDIAINREIVDGRVHRPSTEPSQDQVDDILDAEKQNLLNLKKSLELILKPIQDHLYRLDDIRDRLDKLYKERSVVTDLICQSLTKSMRSYDRANQKRNEKSLVSKSQPNMEDQSQFMEFFDGPNGGGEGKSNVMIGPLSAFTAECIDMMRAAQENIELGRNLRVNSKQLIKECIENSKMYGNCINDAFVKKIEETLALSKILNLSGAENKLAQNRAVRWYDLNNTAYKYSLGPEKYTNLSTYETLDRPIMKSFQKHPGNQVPEAQEIIKGTHELKESLAESEKRIKSLKVIGQKLDQKAKSKEAQVELNNALLRKRRELSDHRWAPVK